MSRYALPLGIIGFIVIVFALVFWGGGSSTPQYTDGDATEPAMSDEWVRGNPAAAVKLVEYSDFQCPACKTYSTVLHELADEFGGSVAFVYRHYPLYQIHPNADMAARAAEAAGVQGKFWQMHDLLFERQSSWSSLLNPTKAFIAYATELGLDATAFTADMESEATSKLVADDYQRGARMSVSGTPTFVLNGVKIPRNPGSIEEFRSLLIGAGATPRVEQ